MGWTYTLDNANPQDLGPTTRDRDLHGDGDRRSRRDHDAVRNDHGQRHNDAPMITSGTQSGSVTEDADAHRERTRSRATGASFNDMTATAAVLGQVRDQGTYGSFVIEIAATEWPVAGPTRSTTPSPRILAPTTRDRDLHGHGDRRSGATTTQSVMITVHGTNDAPMISSGTQSGSVTEDAADTASGPGHERPARSSTTSTATPRQRLGKAWRDHARHLRRLRDRNRGHRVAGGWTYTLDNAKPQDWRQTA